MKRALFSLAALALVSAAEVQTFKHLSDHAPHTHEHEPAKRRTRRNQEVN